MSKKKPTSPDATPEDIRMDTGKPKKKAGRPRAEINLETVYSMAAINCTMEEIASVLKISLGTLSNRKDFTETYKKGREYGKSSLRRVMWQHAQTNPGMAIFLAKNWLGMKDNPEIETEKSKEKVVLIPDRLAESND